MEHIYTKAALVSLAKRLDVRDSWHEPDEQGLTVEIKGTVFDNAGFWPVSGGSSHTDRGAWAISKDQAEMYVEIHQNGRPVAAVNLATLLAWATGYTDD